MPTCPNCEFDISPSGVELTPAEEQFQPGSLTIEARMVCPNCDEESTASAECYLEFQ